MTPTNIFRRATFFRIDHLAYRKTVNVQFLVSKSHVGSIPTAIPIWIAILIWVIPIEDQTSSRRLSTRTAAKSATGTAPGFFASMRTASNGG